LVLATLDTKGPEAAHLGDVIHDADARAVLLDLSVFGPPAVSADIPREEVAAAAGADLETLRTLPRGDALATMAAGATRLAERLCAAGEIAGVVGIGGSQGTVAATRVMAALPFGFPKVMLSTMASADTRPYVGTSDIAMLFPVVDLAGFNRFCRAALRSAGHAVAGMARGWRPLPPAERPEVGVTMFGATTPCVMAAAEHLRSLGVEPVMFHANGIGGRALEAWIARGDFAAVLDLTTTELADELVGGHRSAGPHRLEAAGRRAIPQVVAPGAMDMVNFGPAHTVPREFAGRRLHRHNAGTTLMRTTADENRRLGHWMAEKLNRAKGPRGVVVPLGGFSAYDAPGEPFHDPEADAAFVSALRAGLDPAVAMVEVPAHINDAAFAKAAVDLYVRLTAIDDPALIADG
jgi:uncharacterized protein (UPF0261 family)